MPAPRVTVVLVGFSLIVALAGCKSAADLAVRGDDFYMQGQYARALQDYRQARKKDPLALDLDEKILRTQIRLFMTKGDDAVASGRFDDARRAYEEVRRLDPRNADLDRRLERLTEAQADWHYEQGEQLLSSGDPFAALPEFERVLELRPGHARAQSAIVRARREQEERRVRAEAAYDDGLRASQAGQYEEALALLDQALRLDPHHPGAAFERDHARAQLVDDLIDRGDAAIDQGLWGPAIGLYEQARTLDPSARGLHSRVQHARRELAAQQWLATGDQARKRGEWREAFESYQQARLLTAEPERVEDLLEEARRSYALQIQTDGREAESRHQYDEALDCYRRILEIQPGHPKAGAWLDGLAARMDAAENAYQLGARSQRRGDLVAARDAFERCTGSLAGYLDAAERLDAVGRDVDLARTLYERAREAETGGHYDRARVLFEECLSVTRPFRDAQRRLEQARAEDFRGREIYMPYEEACRAQAARDYPRAQTLLVQCQTERPGYGDVAERLDAVRRALDEAEAAYSRAEQAERRHELDRARDEFAKSLVICTGYRDAEDRLNRIESGLQFFREAHRFQEHHRVGDALKRYRAVLQRFPDHPDARQMVKQLDQAAAAVDADLKLLEDAERKGDYRGALALAVNIRKLGAADRGIDEKITRLEIEADYADARAFEDDGRWQLAARSYERCVKRDPHFRDAGKRLDACREKVAQPGGDDGDRWSGGRGRAGGK